MRKFVWNTSNKNSLIVVSSMSNYPIVEKKKLTPKMQGRSFSVFEIGSHLGVKRRWGKWCFAMEQPEMKKKKFCERGLYVQLNFDNNLV